MDEQPSGLAPDMQGSVPKKAGPELKSPREWALLTSNGPKATPGVEWFGSGMAGMSRPMGTKEHEAAALLHGWRQHEDAMNGPLLMTREDYLAALEATHPPDVYLLDESGKPRRDEWGNPVLDPERNGNPKPHAPALSEHKGAGVRVRLDKHGKKITERVEKSE